MSRVRRWSLVVLVFIAVVVISVFVVYQFALSELRSRVVSALGAQSEIGEIHVSLRDVTITGLRLNAPPGWPVRHLLTAARVVIVPDLGSFTSNEFRVNSIHVEGAMLAVLRDRNGKLQILPSLTASISTPTKSTSEPKPAKTVLIESIVVQDSTVSFFDEEVRSPPLHVKLEKVSARLSNLRVPQLTGSSAIEIRANVIGPTQSGELTVAGKLELATRDGNIEANLRNVEIAALEPYLIKAAETGVRKGTLDLDLAAKIESSHLTAPGRLVLKDLELRSEETAASTFMGMPRDAVIDLIRERDGRIEVPFTLEGNFNDPRFALDRAFKTRLAIATAGALGLTITGIMAELDGVRSKSTPREKADAALESLKRLLQK